LNDNRISDAQWRPPALCESPSAASVSSDAHGLPLSAEGALLEGAAALLQTAGAGGAIKQGAARGLRGKSTLLCLKLPCKLCSSFSAAAGLRSRGPRDALMVCTMAAVPTDDVTAWTATESFVIDAPALRAAGSLTSVATAPTAETLSGDFASWLMADSPTTEVTACTEAELLAIDVMAPESSTAAPLNAAHAAVTRPPRSVTRIGKPDGT
jgi:hypothetical protein